LVVVLLNRVAVLFACVCNTAKNVDIAVRKGAARMVVASLVELRHIIPQVEVDVVLLTLVVSLVLVHARPSDDQELILHHANRMAVSTELEFVPRDTVHALTFPVVDDLVALLQ
jgi:hypothetical protein